MNTLRLIRMFGSVNDIKTSRYQKDIGNWNIQSKKTKKMLPFAIRVVQ